MTRSLRTEKRGTRILRRRMWLSNMGFVSKSSILPRSNFGEGGQESSPQSLTAHSLSRYRHLKKEFTEPLYRIQPKQNQTTSISLLVDLIKPFKCQIKAFEC